MKGIPKEVVQGTTLSMKKVDRLISEMNEEPDIENEIVALTLTFQHTCYIGAILLILRIQTIIHSYM